MNNLRLCLHHIGGRGGSRTFPVPIFFDSDLINILYDADRDCLEKIHNYYENINSETHVLPYALSDKCESLIFNINHDPNTSSLLKKNKTYNLFYRQFNNFDYILGEACKTVEERKIEFVNMDHIYNSKLISCPKPDFLSLITGGGEFKILNGADETFKSSILGVNTEVFLQNFHHEQTNFSELSDYLNLKGFILLIFLHHTDMKEKKLISSLILHIDTL